MGKQRREEHKKLVYVEKILKKSKRACDKWGIDYKTSPHCVGLHGNIYAQIDPNMKYVWGKNVRRRCDLPK